LAETAESTTTDLVKWIRSVLPDVPAIARPLGARERASGIDVRLIAASPRPAARSAEPPAILDLDYLVTVQMTDAEAEQQALVELLFAAMDRHECEVITGKDIAQLCAQLGFPAAAGFILRKPLVRERDIRPAKRVHKLVVHTAPMGVIEGRVLGPQDIPIAGAVISAPGLSSTARSDPSGRFRIAGIPGTADGVTLTARAHGAEVDGVALAGKPIILRLPLED
jgi:hypothetical protein